MAHRVLFYTDSQEFWGAEQVLVNLMDGLNPQDWKATLYYHETGGILPLTQAAQSLGVRVKAIPPMPLGIQGAKRGIVLAREIRKLRPAIFHANLTWPLSCKYGLFASILARVPVVIAVLHSFVDIPYTRSERTQLRLLTRGINRYITVSYDMKNKVKRVFNLPEDRLQVVHNGIPFGSPTIQPDLGLHPILPITGQRPTILTIARLVEEKGLEDLLQAAVQVPDALFLLAGDGPLRETLERKVRALGIASRFLFLGYREDTDDLLSTCDLFVLPSYNEGLPLSILEAMAAGKAVVASEVGGIGEAVVHGETGWLVPPGDPERLAASIRGLLEDPQLAHRFGVAGRARVLESFSVNAMVEQYTSTYESLLRLQGAVDGR